MPYIRRRLNIKRIKKNAKSVAVTYTCYVSTFWGIRVRVTDIVVASLPYGLLVSISPNPDNTNTKSSGNECKWNKHNRIVNSIAIGVRKSKEKVLRQSASVSSDAAKVTLLYQLLVTPDMEESTFASAH